MKRLITRNANQTKEFGKVVAGLLKVGDIICLSGDLGAGKTTLVKGLASGLRIKEDHVNSPTFVLLNIYEGKLPLFHFDLYRMNSTAEILEIGYEEFFYGQGVAVIEWAERLDDLMPKEYLSIELIHKGEDTRDIVIHSKGGRYQRIIKALTKVKTQCA
jgi:tRNA threonylcarbamoyladenosine biosynthesis protein TsaE